MGDTIIKLPLENRLYAWSSRLRALLSGYYIFVILIILWISSSIASPYFRTMDTFSNIITSAVPIALIGLGQTFVVLSRGFDLSVGAVASMATAVASVTMIYGILPGVVLVLLIAVIIGALNGLGITKLHIDPFIMTLCMMFFLTGLNFLVRPSSGGFIPATYKKILLLQVSTFPIVPFLILLSAATFGYVVLKRRKFGRYIYAVGNEPNYACMSGINVDRVRIKVYILSAVASALGGLFIAARIGSGNAQAGAQYLFDSFTTVFMGGTLVTGGVGGYSGTLGAALIISSLGQLLQFLGVNIWYQYIIKGVLLASVAGLQLYFVVERRSKDDKNCKD
jgi:ribose/xylose/arabinose/galactoside ABC-type transport system permease subunit